MCRHPLFLLLLALFPLAMGVAVASTPDSGQSTLIVQSDPPGLYVYLNEMMVGATPVEIGVAEGPANLRVQGSSILTDGLSVQLLVGSDPILVFSVNATSKTITRNLQAEDLWALENAQCSWVVERNSKVQDTLPPARRVLYARALLCTQNVDEAAEQAMRANAEGQALPPELEDLRKHRMATLVVNLQLPKSIEEQLAQTPKLQSLWIPVFQQNDVILPNPEANLQGNHFVITQRDVIPDIPVTIGYTPNDSFATFTLTAKEERTENVEFSARLSSLFLKELLDTDRIWIQVAGSSKQVAMPSGALTLPAGSYQLVLFRNGLALGNSIDITLAPGEEKRFNPYGTVLIKLPSPTPPGSMTLGGAQVPLQEKHVLPVGSYAAHVSLEGYQPCDAEALAISEATVEVPCVWNLIPGWVEIARVPKEAKIVVQNSSGLLVPPIEVARTGNTAALALPPGSYRILIDVAERLPEQHNITIIAEHTQYLRSTPQMTEEQKKSRTRRGLGYGLAAGGVATLGTGVALTVNWGRYRTAAFDTHDLYLNEASDTRAFGLRQHRDTLWEQSYTYGLFAIVSYVVTAGLEATAIAIFKGKGAGKKATTKSIGERRKESADTSSPPTGPSNETTAQTQPTESAQEQTSSPQGTEAAMPESTGSIAPSEDIPGSQSDSDQVPKDETDSTGEADQTSQESDIQDSSVDPQY